MLSHSFIYLATSEAWWKKHLAKLGCTKDPVSRLDTYLTGSPPGQTPSLDMEFYALWETAATTRGELLDLEERVHDHFHQHRLVRRRPGDSEWFDFRDEEWSKVEAWIDAQPWVRRKVPLCEIPRLPKPLHLRKCYNKNVAHYIKDRKARNATLCAIQQPVIDAIATFVVDPDRRAGCVIAPCGAGKTMMCARGIRGVRKCIICCPSRQIQDQWRATLVAERVFDESQIHIIGGAGTTSASTIRAILEQHVVCLISTYMSSHLVVDSMRASTQLLVLDEAHHMAGVVAPEETGDGRTRRLLQRACDLSVKRLSLTYTPRFLMNNGDANTEFLTMDDERVFGQIIAELKIRDLIRKGVLPDYRLWHVHDQANRGAGILGKAQCILEAWEETEMVRDEEKHILHHLIVFAATTQEAKDLQHFFQENATDTLVLRVQQGDYLPKAIAQFEAAPRAILVNCFVLNEGVDISIANAVAITYPKQSRGQITQMILRAGRYEEGKSVFHVLMPTLGEEDLSGMQEVLSALASCDDQIRDEILLVAKRGAASSANADSSCSATGDTKPQCIMIDEYEAKREEIQRCFANIRKDMMAVKCTRRIQALCVEKGVDTSVEYETVLRATFPELPEDPRPSGKTWYGFLHEDCGHCGQKRMTPAEFVEILDANHLRLGRAYEEWRRVQPTDVMARLPSAQHITDGFFGAEFANFNALCERYSKQTVPRGR